MVHNLINTVKMMENYLNSDNSPIAFLRPRFLIAGSIVEGTRLGSANELDLTLRFESMTSDHFKIGDSALAYHLTDKGTNLMKNFSDENDCFNMITFLKTLLQSIQFCFKNASGKLPRSVSTVQESVEWMPCDSCKAKKMKSLLEPWTHCSFCIPTVAMTRAGPCVILEHDFTLISIDIIPMLPSPVRNPVELYNLVTQTLIREQPVGWQKYLQRFLKTDRILPESIALVKDSAKPFICLKILSFEGTSGNFILRPGQILENDQLQDTTLKTVYCHMKALKDHFRVNIKSYILKKVVLLPGNLEKAKDNTQDEYQLLFHYLSHPSLKTEFEKHINYPKWKSAINSESWYFGRDVIPHS